MALTHTTAVRNAIANLIDDQVNAGTADAGGDLRLIDSAATIAIITFQNPAHGAAAAGVITVAGTPLEVAATGTTTDGVDSFEVRDRDNTVVYSGTVTGTGGGGDLEIDNVNINSGQTVRLSSMTYAAPV